MRVSRMGLAAAVGKGKGKGNKCPNCGNQTLHAIHRLQSGRSVTPEVAGSSPVDPATNFNQISNWQGLMREPAV